MHSYNSTKELKSVSRAMFESAIQIAALADWAMQNVV